MKRVDQRPGYRNGFTLIELLITLAILGLLATLVLPVSRTIIQRDHEQHLRHDLREIRNAIDGYKKAYDDGRFPKSVGESGYPKNLQVLVDGVVDQIDPKHKKIFFLRRIPRDPMNPDITQTPDETWGKRCFDSEADEPSEGSDVFDVYSKSQGIGLNGAPYDKW
jgi:general secretion pathway protein G